MNWHLLEMSFVAKFSLSKAEKSFSDLSEKAESKAIGNCTEISGGCKDFLALWMAYSPHLMQSASLQP